MLIAALTDTLSEHPDLYVGRENFQQSNKLRVDGQQILRQILQLSPEEKAIVRAALLPYNNDDNQKKKTNRLLRNDKAINQLDIGQGTYLSP